ncbi:MAG: hypothetical protein HYY29_01270 [Chloroflexi bacterium]|nr:hypothetical protein [Chloroflexota bacterium]
MSEQSDLFRFAAKAGSLEGYLFKRDKVEPLSNWVGNLEGMYRSLSPAARKEIRVDLEGVLQRVLEYGERTLLPDLKGRLNQLLADVRQGD